MSDSSLTPVGKLIKIVNSYCITKEIPYVIVGGIAVLFWGRPRTTQDVDIIIDHFKLDIDDFVDYLIDNNVQCSKDDLQQAFKNKQPQILIFIKIQYLDWLLKESIQKMKSNQLKKDISNTGKV